MARGDIFLTTKVWISNAGYEKAKTEILSGAELMSYNVTLESAPGSLLMEYRERPARFYR